MTDPVAVALIAGTVTVIQSALTIWSGKKTRSQGKRAEAKVVEEVTKVHTLVNDHSTKQDEKIDELHAKVAALVKEAKQ